MNLATPTGEVTILSKKGRTTKTSETCSGRRRVFFALTYQNHPPPPSLPALDRAANDIRSLHHLHAPHRVVPSISLSSNSSHSTTPPILPLPSLPPPVHSFACSLKRAKGRKNFSPSFYSFSFFFLPIYSLNFFPSPFSLFSLPSFSSSSPSFFFTPSFSSLPPFLLLCLFFS